MNIFRTLFLCCLWCFMDTPNYCTSTKFISPNKIYCTSTIYFTQQIIAPNNFISFIFRHRIYIFV